MDNVEEEIDWQIAFSVKCSDRSDSYFWITNITSRIQHIVRDFISILKMVGTDDFKVIIKVKKPSLNEDEWHLNAPIVLK